MSAKPNDEEAFTIIKELKKRIDKLEKEQARDRENFGNERGMDRQRIADLEEYLDVKNNGGRRDFDLLTIKLKKEVLNRRTGMDYKDILNFFHFKSHEEAFRLMNKTVGNFPLELKLHKNKTGRGGRTMIVQKAM